VSKHKAARRRAGSSPAPVPSTARGGARRRARGGPSIRRTAALTALAVTATGTAVAGGVLASTSGLAPATSPRLSADSLAAATLVEGIGQTTLTADELAARRDEQLSRSDRRTAADPDKVAALDSGDSPAEAHTQDLSDADPRVVAQALLPEFGFGPEQFPCLDALYLSESGWRVDADNPYSSAYGIPQALPGSKMASAGADWATNPVTQIRWGLGYIQDRYGTPCGAWSFKQSHNWY
jgi:hypothetical protein